MYWKQPPLTEGGVEPKQLDHRTKVKTITQVVVTSDPLWAQWPHTDDTDFTEVFDRKWESHYIHDNTGGTQLGGKLNQKGDLELRHNDRYKLQLTKYYQQVISKIKDVDSIFIMGPGEAKIELQKALKRHKNMQNRLLKSETADKMTMNQMIAHVRKFYQEQAIA